MNNITAVMEKYMSPIASKLSRNKYLQALRDGLAPTIPIIIFGSIIMLIPNLPFLEDMIGVDAVEGIRSLIGQSSSVTMNLTALVISFTIAYNYCKREKVDPLSGGLTAMFSFLMLIPLTISETGSKSISLDVTGSQGLFLALLTSMICGNLYCRFHKKGWTIHMPEGVPEAVAKSFASLIPMILTFAIFTIVRIGFSMTPYLNAVAFIFTVLQTPLMFLGGNIFSVCIAVFLNQFIWFFGIHGGMVVGTVYNPILLALSQQNFDLVANGLAPINIINAQFFTIFFESSAVAAGVLAILLIVIPKRKDYREVGKFALPPAIFNIGEPLAFGLPTVLNPYMLIPLVICPVIPVIIGYLATVSGLIPICINAVPWTTPVFINAILSTGSLMSAVVQLVGIIACVFIWIPFIKMMEKNQDKVDAENLANKALEE